MGFLDKLRGNAGEVDVSDAEEEYGRILAPDEKIGAAYKVFRDTFLFTDTRLVLVDKQGLSGKKVEYRSIPYSSIRQFSVETVGHFDADAELKIWVAGMDDPIEKEFSKEVDIYELQSILSMGVGGGSTTEDSGGQDSPSASSGGTTFRPS